MSRKRNHNLDVPDETGLFKKCDRRLDHRWKKCSCEWYATHRNLRGALYRFWRAFYGVHRAPTSYAMAVEMARDYCKAVDEGKWPKRRLIDLKLSVASELKIYRAHPTQVKLASDSKYWMLVKFEKDFGREKLADIYQAQAVIADWLTELQQEREWTGKTFNEWRGAISTFFQFCVKRHPDVCLRDPMMLLDKQEGSPLREVRIETAEQMFFGASASMKRRLAGALDIGLRRGEMLDARVRHVNVDRRSLILPALMTKGGKTRKIKTAQELTIGSPRLWKVAYEQVQTLPPDAFLFGTDDGKEISFKQHYQEAKALFDKHGLQWEKWDVTTDDGEPIGRRWHDIRHEFCFRMASNPAINQQEKMKAMRVHDLETFNRYYKPDDQKIREAFESVNRYITAEI